jgi:predicted  nucleic acid-binding Zn-ribbon protein
MSRAAALYHLQLVDQKLDAQRRLLAQLMAQLGETPELQAARARAAEAEAAVLNSERHQRALEGELELLTDKITSVEQQLYGGRVGNPKELADLQRESQAHGRRRQTLEDEDLAAMIAVDDARAARDQAAAELAALEQSWRASQGGVLAERDRLEAQIAATSEERAITLQAVLAEDLALYQSLRPRKGGQPVGILRDGTCSACGVAPSAARIASTRREDTLVRCGNCERILYTDLGHFVADEEL